MNAADFHALRGKIRDREFLFVRAHAPREFVFQLHLKLVLFPWRDFDAEHVGDKHATGCGKSVAVLVGQHLLRAIDVFVARVRQSQRGSGVDEVIPVPLAYGHFGRGDAVIHFDEGLAICAAKIRDVVKKMQRVFARTRAIVGGHDRDGLLVDDPGRVFHHAGDAGDAVVALRQGRQGREVEMPVAHFVRKCKFHPAL